MSANAADLVPAVEAYLEANGLEETLSAMKAEAKAKKMTPSKTVRARLDEARASRRQRHRRNRSVSPPIATPRRRPDPGFAAVNRGISLAQTLHQRRYWEQFAWHPSSRDEQWVV